MSASGFAVDFQGRGAIGGFPHVNHCQLYSLAHLLCGKPDCLQSGATNLVDRQRGNIRQKPAAERGLAGGILSEACRDNVAHNALINLLGIESGPLYRFAHYDRAQLGRAQV